MRVTSAFSRLLALPGVWVRSVRFEPDRVVVTLALRARLLRCPKCSYSTRHRENKRGRVAGGIAAPGSHGSGRDTLASPGSSHQPSVRADPLPVGEQAGLSFE